MQKKSTLLVLIMALMMMPLSMTAQLPKNRIPAELQKAMLAVKATKMGAVKNGQSKALKTSIKLPKALNQQKNVKTPFAQPLKSFKAPKTYTQKGNVQSPLKADGFSMTNPIGYVNYSNTDETLVSNFCEFSPFGGATVISTAPCSYSPSAGGAIIDGTYYSFYVDDSYASWFGIYFYYIIGFNTETWELDQTKTASLDYNTFENYVIACTKTADDKLFCQTFNSNANALEFAKFTLGENEDGVVTTSREKISDVSTQVICMTSTKDGVIYAVGVDNALYTIDANTGAMTKIGDTGYAAYEEGYYGQSMCYDDKAGKLIWFAVGGDGSEAPILEVNTTTGATSEYIPTTGITQVLGAVVPAPAAEDAAPAAITDLAINVTAPALTGTATFTMPSTTFSGEPLTGNLQYNIVFADGNVLEGEAEAGASVTANINVAQGANTVYVITRNTSGNSPKSKKISFWAGYDQPMDPDSVTAVKGLYDEGAGMQSVAITWKAVKTGVHEGFVGDVTYNVYQLINGNVDKEIYHAITDTTIIEEIELGDLAAYSWEVEAVNGSQISNLTISNTLVIGNPVQCPVTWGNNETGFTESQFSLFTIVDANEDGCTWGYSPYSSCPFQYAYSSDNQADDWAFTPKIAVKAGKRYYITYAATSYSNYWPEKLEIKVGNDATVDAMTTTAVEEYELPSEVKDSVFEYTATEDGTLVIGFHAVSDPDMFDLLLWKVSVEKAPEQEAPAAVNNLTVTPGAKGALKAIIDFAAPTKNVAGGKVAPLTEINLYRDGELIYTFNGVAGIKYQYTDDEITENGTYTYKVVAYNEYGYGNPTTTSAYIGMDSPTNINDAYLTDLATSVRVDWTKVGEKGINGGYVDPTQVTYEIYNVESGYVGDQIFTGVDVNTATINGVNTDEGDASLLQYAMRATNDMGESEYYGTDAIVVGAPVVAPLTEPFIGGSIENYWWISRTGNGAWALSDEYACFMEANAGDTGWLSTAKLNIKNIATPGVILDVKQVAGVKFSVTGMSRDGVEETFATFTSEATEETAQWETKIITLPEEWKAKDFVIIRLKAEAEVDVPDPYMLCVRNFMVRDIIDDDLSITLSTPKSAKKGETIIGYAKVTNEGTNSAEKYTVKITCGNELVQEQTIEETLAPFASRMINFGIPTSIFDKNDAATIDATVTYEGDLNEDNNEDEAEVELVTSEATPVCDLAANQTEDGVVLTWNAAEAFVESRAEGFEDYDNAAAFPLTENPDKLAYFTEWNKVGTLGPWTAYDLDGGAIYGWSSDLINFPYMGYGMGFCVLDYNEVFSELDDPSEMAHEGTKSLFCMDIAPAGETGAPTNNDDWLISSLLPGTAQTISFYAREITSNYGAETFEVLYSTTDMETASFTKLTDGEISTEDWTQMSYDLPEGAKYFAIRVTSADIFGAIFDDIKYQAVGDTPVSFNIYRDGEKVDNTTAKTYTYNETVSGTHTYSVTAVYANGDESVPQNVTIDVTTAINAINGEASKNVIFRLDGVNVKEAKTGVNIINGKATLVK